MNEVIVVLVSLIVGYFTGVATGLFGIGGGVIYVPALFFLLEAIYIPDTSLAYVVIATSLFAGSFGSTGAFINHFRVNNVNLSKGFLLASGSVIAALILPHFVITISPQLLKIILCGILFLVAVRMSFDDTKSDGKLNLDKKYLVFFGVLVGAVSTVTGLGGGILFVPILIYLFSLDVKYAIGSSSMAVAFTMIFSSISYALMEPAVLSSEYQLGYINILTGLPLGIGAIVGSRLGVRLVFKYKNAVIKRIFSLLLFILIIRLMFSL